jgi:GNAT superfamily N-acetyltransferase
MIAPAPTDIYIAAFTARCAARRQPGQPAVEQPGLHGLLPSAQSPLTRLLVTDDHALSALAELLPDVQAGMVDVFATATRCTALLHDRPPWRAESLTAMSCGDLQAVPAIALPGGLSLRPVRRGPPGEAGRDTVALEDAVATAIDATPGIAETPSALAAYLRSLPRAFSFLAAVDDGGAVRATSGAGAFGPEATVIFVNTEPGWRGRGIGRAMTAAALHAARDAGARRASLDASPAGLSIYVRLGFDVVGALTRFAHPGLR